MLNAFETLLLTALVGVEFRKNALAYFSREDLRTSVQRIDGIRCFAPDEIAKAPFLNMRLAFMVRLGDLRVRTINGVFRSTRGMPWYGLPEEM